MNIGVPQQASDVGIGFVSAHRACHGHGEHTALCRLQPAEYHSWRESNTQKLFQARSHLNSVFILLNLNPNKNVSNLAETCIFSLLHNVILALLYRLADYLLVFLLKRHVALHFLFKNRDFFFPPTQIYCTFVSQPPLGLMLINLCPPL